MASDKPYIYSIDFTLVNVDLFEFPSDLDYLVRFQMNPSISLEVTQDEHIDALNMSEKATKRIIFPMTESQLKCDLKASITAYQIQCPDTITPWGCYTIQKLHCKFQELKRNLDCQEKTGKSCVPPCEVIKELSPLQNCDENRTGCVEFCLTITCYGPRFSCDGELQQHLGNSQLDTDEYGRLKNCTVKTEHAANDCVSPCPCDESQYDEYSASVNGNILTVRVTKDHFVTRVFDSSCVKDKLTIRGCDQQIDFNFPNNFTCCKCKKKFGSCKCNGDSDLTDFQKRIGCSGSSYKNSRSLPAIRGNLKYPGRFEDQTVDFDVQDHCKPTEATEKYRVKSQKVRAVCIQADDGSSMSKGIEVCKVGCEDDVDVFVWKICQKRTSRNGKQAGIELEMRTPRGPKIDIPKKETREVQVIEEEFEDRKKALKKESTSTVGGSGKKVQLQKGTTKKSNEVPKKAALSKATKEPAKKKQTCK